MSLSCYGGTLPGVIKTEYTGVITALSPCNDWVLSYSICCRNNAPLNVSSPGTTSLYVETNLDNSIILNDKSPVYADNPRWIIPVNQTSYINAGAYDADGDSLYFSMVPTMNSGGAPVPYMAGYSVTQPFGGALTSMNNQTGIITATPNVLGMSIITVKVDEFRNGQFLSSVVREFSINVINDPNSLPAITNTLLNFTVCVPDTLEFDLYSMDATDSVTTTVLPGSIGYSSFSNTTFPWNVNTDFLNDTNSFYWDLLVAQASREYIAYVNVSSPLASCAIGIQSYAVTVSTTCGSPCSVDIPTDTITACQALAQLNAIPTGGQAPYNFSWSPATGLSNPVIANPTVSQAHNQMYIVTMTDGLGCQSQDSVIVNAYNPVFDTLDICSPDSVLLDFGPGASAYFWQFFTDTLGNTSPLTGSNQTMMAYQPGDYMGYANFPGCGSLTSIINVQDTCTPGPCITFDIVTTPPSCPTCTDGTASVINLTGGCAPYTFLWDDPSTQTSATAINLGVGTYNVIIVDAGACCPTTTGTTCLSCDSVWPGDANSDLIANVYDLLPIGVYYNTTGAVRPSATTNWTAQWSADWGVNQGTGADIKHVDCDGDSLIDLNDVNPILLNYGLMHSKGVFNNSTQGINDPLLYVDIALDTILTSTPLSVPVKFGTSTLPADSIYGLAFSITYDQNLIDSIAGITVDYSNSWLGTEGVDMITLDTNFYNNGKIDIGLVRTDGQMMGGFGEILTLNIITIDNLSGKTILYETQIFDFNNVVIINNIEEYKAFNQQLDSVIIKDLNTGIETAYNKNYVRIIPNPNSGSFKVYISDFINSSIEIYNTMGQLVDFTYSNQNGYLKVDMTNFNKGMYFVKVINKNKSTTIEKVVIN
jgi:hypothetical protein